MTPIDRFERHLPDRLAELANPHVPDYFDDLLTRTRRSRQRRAWTFLERWLPMALLTQSDARVRPLRQTWQLLVVLAVTLALMAGLAVAGARLLLPQPPEQGFNSLVTVPTLELVETWDADSTSGLSKILGMDVAPDGNLYVVNGGTSEILVIDPAGRVVRRWGEAGSGDGQFGFQRHPDDSDNLFGSVAVSDDGRVYVADLTNSRVQVFDLDGEYLAQWGTYGPGNGQFLELLDTAVGPDGTVYAVDDVRGDIQRFTADGDFLATIGSAGSGDGQLNNTGFIAVDPAGNLLNADYDNHRVQAWGPDGAFLWSLSHESSDGSFNPLDVAVDDSGSMYMTDGGGVLVYGPDRDLLASWSAPISTGPDDEAFVAVPDDGSAIYLASWNEGVIRRLSVGSRQVESSPAPSMSSTAEPWAWQSDIPAETSHSPAPGDTLLAVRDPFLVPFTLDLPARWSGAPPVRGEAGVALRRDADNTPAYVVVSVPINAYADPCQTADGPMSPAMGPSVDDLVDALTDAVGFRAGPVTDVTIDGFHGMQFDLTNDIDIDGCSGKPWLHQWTYDASTSGEPVIRDSEDLSGSYQHIAVLDVDGTRVVVWAWTFRQNTTLDEVQEAYQVFDSIDFQ